MEEYLILFNSNFVLQLCDKQVEEIIVQLNFLEERHIELAYC